MSRDFGIGFCLYGFDICCGHDHILNPGEFTIIPQITQISFVGFLEKVSADQHFLLGSLLLPIIDQF